MVENYIQNLGNSILLLLRLAPFVKSGNNGSMFTKMMRELISLKCILFIIPILTMPAVTWQASAGEKPALVLVMGAAGEEEFGRQFLEWAQRWETAARRAEVKIVKIGFDNSVTNQDRELLIEALEKEPKEGSAELWLVLLGHGTFDGKEI